MSKVGEPRAGRLHRIHRGVYAVGHTRLSFEGRCMAAVLALGDGAVVSHRSAAALWGLLAFPAGFVDVTVAEVAAERSVLGSRFTALSPSTTPRRPAATASLSPGRSEPSETFTASSVGLPVGRPQGARPAPDLCGDLEPRRPHPQRARAHVPRPLSPPSPSPAGRQRTRWPVRGRLPLARSWPHRRDRRFPAPRRPGRVRGRPRSDARLQSPGFPRPPVHLPPA